jgi:hypothetical protein
MPETETDYWRKAATGLAESDYPEVNADEARFPETIYVAFAVCHKGCGRREFIVDGSTQICHYCGKMMFRVVSKEYRLAAEADAGG